MPDSLWVATAPEASYPQLSEPQETEICVGGGIAGMTAALLLH